MPVDQQAEAVARRRVPSQARSRERVERILDIAKGMLVEKGSDALRMGEIAELAGISIGSLYQYFPDKAAVIGTLADRFNAIGHACVAAELRSVTSGQELAAAMDRVIDGYYQMFLAEPAMRAIWQATHADKALQAIDAADVAAHQALLRDVLTRLRPTADPSALAINALLTMQFVATAVRLAIAAERTEGDAIIARFKAMLVSGLLKVPARTQKSS